MSTDTAINQQGPLLDKKHFFGSRDVFNYDVITWLYNYSIQNFIKFLD